MSVSEPIKKHLRVIGYLTLSALVAYLASILADRPEYIYLAPVINYILYAIEKESSSEGVVKTMLKK